MKRLSGFALILFFAIAGLSRPATRPPGQEALRFPLDQPAGLVASFGEYRADHLHPGVDFSTGGRNGLPVRAVAGGRIYRLKVEWRGYGRALYVRHADGRISVYAHLDRYEDERLGLERIVEVEKRKRGLRYPGDILLEPSLAVKQGDVIAFSGESGAGLPHLHFELRREDQEPADPLDARWIAAGAPPVFESVILRSASPDSWIDGARVREVPLSRGKDGVYSPPRAIAVTGPILPESRLHSEDSQGHRLGIKALTVRIDGMVVYRFKLESFRFSQYPQVGLLLDHAMSRLSPAEYTYFLSRLKGNDLGRTGLAESPFPSLTPGTHRLEVEAEGTLGGPVAKARIPLESLPSARLRWDDPREEDGDRRTLRFGIPRAALGPGARVVYRAAGGDRGVILCGSRQELSDGERCALQAGGEAAGITAELFSGARFIGRATLFFDQQVPFEARAPRSRIEVFSSHVDLHLGIDKGFVPPALLVVKKRDGIEKLPLAQEASGEFLAAVPVASWREAVSLGVEWRNGSAARGLDPPVFPHFIRREAGVRIEDCGMEMAIPAQALYDDTPAQCERWADSPPPEEGLSLLGPALRLLPSGLPLAVKGSLRFPIPASEPHPERLGIYRLADSDRGWAYQGGEVAGGVLQIPVGRFDTYAVIRDDAAPRILGVDPLRQEGGTGRRDRLRVRVEERGSGLSYDGVHLILGDAEIETEYDPDRGWSTAVLPGGLPAGAHSGTAWAVDRAGNRSASLAFEFTTR
ncbi:MAG TPA: M23 family metallopeptidase [Candidatus Polarisedimenticolia bacterium]|nr:M23 family metallopeptidase [Candidatus Polarisedimenticolia bacterium]